VHAQTLQARRRLYLLARVVVARNYRRRLTLAAVATAVSSSPRQVQRAYAQFGDTSFHEDLLARRMAAAAQLLAEQPTLSVRDVAQLVGYRHAPHFARAFRRRYGLAPACFRKRALAYRRESLAGARADQAVERSRESCEAPASGSAAGSDAPGATASAPGRRRRMSVPPLGGDSAATPPPCCSAT
jgi:AraC family transcriptional regulator, regulatory protein of adaptative response / methylphosphotriester-DNA alkyltransferase methyltransferase